MRASRAIHARRTMGLIEFNRLEDPKQMRRELRQSGYCRGRPDQIQRHHRRERKS